MTRAYDVLKLIDGNQIIGAVSSRSVNSDVVRVTNPLIMYETMTETGMIVVYFRKYNTLSSKDFVDITKSSVISHYEPAEDLINYYNVMTEYHQYTDDELKHNVNSASKVIEQYIDNHKNKKTKGKNKPAESDELSRLADAFSRIITPDKKDTKH